MFLGRTTEGRLDALGCPRSTVRTGRACSDEAHMHRLSPSNVFIRRDILAVMTTRLFAALFLAFTPVACTAMSTYPPTAGKPISTPNVSPGPEVMAGAIKEAYRVSGLDSTVVFNLPAGLQSSTWTRVANTLGNGAKPMEAGDLNVFSVQQLRVSGGVAEVDVVYPERGVYQLMTVKFIGGGLSPWKVDWAYRWVIPATAPIANTPETLLAKPEPAPTEPASSEPAPATEVAGESTTEPAAATTPNN